MREMIERILLILLVLTVISGFLKKKKLHEYLLILTIFSTLLHVLQNPSFSIDCFIVLIFLGLAFLTGLNIKTKNRLKLHTILGVIALIVVLYHVIPYFYQAKVPAVTEAGIKLPEPRMKGEMSVEEAILKRRSIRNFQDKAISLEQLSQLLWAAQGITDETGKRTVPSAGMTYPLEIYMLVRKVNDVNPGVYQYIPNGHSLKSIKSGDYSSELMKASLNQQSIKDGSINIIITADFSRTTSTYGERGNRYVYLEAGHCAQNIYLQATSLDLGGVVVGAFNDESVQDALSIPENHKPIYLIPIGYPS